MQTRVSTKGQIVLPSPVRRHLGIRAGDPLNVEVDGTRIVLTAKAGRKRTAKIIEDPATGLPVLSLGTDDAPLLTNRDVDEMLSNFP